MMRWADDLQTLAKRFAKPALLFSAIVATVGCSLRSDISVEIGDDVYSFPRRIVESYIPANKGILFVRLHTPRPDVHVIYDGRLSTWVRTHPADIPIISGLTTNRFEKFEVIKTSVGPVACGKQTPAFDCGYLLTDGKAVWSVLLGRNKLREIEQVDGEVRTYLAAFRLKT